MKIRFMFLMFLISLYANSQQYSEIRFYNESQAKQILLNKTLYTVTTKCHQKAGTDTKFIHLDKKFVPVTITDIIQIDKKRIEIYFKNDVGQINFVKILLYNRNNEIYDAWGLEFKEIFSFNNPRDKYPEIKDNVWNLIQNSEVQIGMTKQECILSWGEPKDKNKTITEYNIHEQWVYYTGYLYFDNDKLTTIQNN